MNDREPMDDREMESLLRRMPLTRPGDEMDTKVLARRPRRVAWPLALGGGTLAAAATLVLALTLGWFGQRGEVSPLAPPVPCPAHTGYGDHLMPTERVDNAGPLVPTKPGDTTNPSPTRKVRESADGKTTWTGRDDSVHVEDPLNPHEEEIHIEVPVE